MSDVENFTSRCFETKVMNQDLSIRMLGVSKQCLELRTDWYLYALNGLKGPFKSIEIDLLTHPTVNSAFIAGALELRNNYLDGPIKKVRLINTNERITGLMRVMNLFSFFTVAPNEDSSDHDPQGLNQL